MYSLLSIQNLFKISLLVVLSKNLIQITIILIIHYMKGILKYVSNYSYIVEWNNLI